MEIDRRSFFSLSALAAASGLTGSVSGAKVMLKGPKETRGPRTARNHFVLDGKSAVAVAGGEGGPRALVRRAVEAIGGLGKIGVRGKTVLVKPNVVGARGSPTTTSPGVVGAVVRMLYEEGASSVLVGDMSSLLWLPTERNMERTGVARAALEAGAKVLYFEDHEWVRVRLPEAGHIKEVDVSEWIFRAGLVINLPVIKTHKWAGYSICLKNFVGATNFRQRPYFVDRSHWEEVVAEINLAYAPDLNVVDGTRVMAAGGPFSGTVREAGVVMAGGDRVAVDAAGVALIKSYGLWEGGAGSPWDQRQIRRAAELGLGARGAKEVALVKAGEGPALDALFGAIAANLA